MKSIKISSQHQQALQEVLIKYYPVRDIITQIDQQGGRVFLVGGAVRDVLLDRVIKDLDIEVHGLLLSQLEEILRHYGPVSLVGKSFGVLRLHVLDVDWSLPRTDSSGRKPTVSIDPFMSVEDAFRRRDLTINAMGIDLITHELVDPFGGLEDLHNKILRAPDSALFAEDPLRFFRVMQFVGRFEMVPDVALNELCKTMDISGVSRERIEVEFEKLFLKSKRPSLGIRWLHSIGRLHEVLPEVAALVGVPQEPDWHPEGDVFEHTMQAVDAAAETECDAAKKLIIIYAALCHDLGKATTTKLIDGRLRSFGHADVGTELARTMLHRITHNVALIDSVCLLVKYHLLPGEFIASDASRAAYKRLARKLAPDLNLQMLADVARADKRGRNPYGPEPLMAPVEDIDKFLERAQEAQVKDHSEEPALQGRDLIDQIQPGPAMGELLKKAYEIQIEEGIQDKEVLKKRVLENLS